MVAVIHSNLVYNDDCIGLFEIKCIYVCIVFDSHLICLIVLWVELDFMICTVFFARLSSMFFGSIYVEFIAYLVMKYHSVYLTSFS